MINSKKTLLSLATAAVVMTGFSGQSLADVKIGQIDVSGYLDMSISNEKEDGEKAAKSAGLDLAEVRFKSSLDDKTTIEVHVTGDVDNNFNLEQANVSYAATEQVTVIAGEYLSALGFEAYHAPDLYQYSVSAAIVYPGMMNGVGAKYKGEGFEVYGSALSSAWDNSDTDPDSGAYEASFRLTAIDNLTVFLGYATEEFGDATAGTDWDRQLINLWSSYTVGKLVVAAEYNDLTDWDGKDESGDSWLVMANYGLTDKAAITLRTSARQNESAVLDNKIDVNKWTVAGSYSLTSNLSLVAEYSSLKDNLSKTDIDSVALEAIITF